MRLGLIGLGRIGAFPENTLVEMPRVDSVVVTSPCTVADGLEADWIAEACSTSWKEHRPVRIEELRSA
jgi:hypothetical protein